MYDNCKVQLKKDVVEKLNNSPISASFAQDDDSQITNVYDSIF